MKRKAISIVTALMAAILITTTVFAGAIRLSGTARLGSIEFFGTAYGLGRTDWILDMSATGHADVICTNNGSNDVRGQSSPKVTGKATETLPADSQLRKNGKSTFTITAKPEEEVNPIIPWDLGGCPNPNWTAKIFFVYWDSLTILVKDPDTGLVEEEFNYTCNTTYIPQNDGYTFDDGTITCEEIN